MYSDDIMKKSFWFAKVKQKKGGRWPFKTQCYIEDLSGVIGANFYGEEFSRAQVATDLEFSRFYNDPQLLRALVSGAIGGAGRRKFALIMNGYNSNAMLGKLRNSELAQFVYKTKNMSAPGLETPNIDANAQRANDEPGTRVIDFIRLLQAERFAMHPEVIGLTPAREDSRRGYALPSMEGGRITTVSADVVDNFDKIIKGISDKVGIDIRKDEALTRKEVKLTAKKFFGGLDVIRRKVSLHNEGINYGGWPKRYTMTYPASNTHGEALYGVIKALSAMQVSRLADRARETIVLNPDATNIPSVAMFDANRRMIIGAAACLVASDICHMMGLSQADARAISDTFKFEACEELKLMGGEAMTSEHIMPLIADFHAIAVNNYAVDFQIKMADYANSRGISMETARNFSELVYASNVPARPLSAVNDLDSEARLREWLNDVFMGIRSERTRTTEEGLGSREEYGEGSGPEGVGGGAVSEPMPEDMSAPDPVERLGGGADAEIIDEDTSTEEPEVIETEDKTLEEIFGEWFNQEYYRDRGEFTPGVFDNWVAEGAEEVIETPASTPVIETPIIDPEVPVEEVLGEPTGEGITHEPTITRQTSLDEFQETVEEVYQDPSARQIYTEEIVIERDEDRTLRLIYERYFSNESESNRFTLRSEITEEERQAILAPFIAAQVAGMGEVSQPGVNVSQNYNINNVTTNVTNVVQTVNVNEEVVSESEADRTAKVLEDFFTARKERNKDKEAEAESVSAEPSEKTSNQTVKTLESFFTSRAALSSKIEEKFSSEREEITSVTGGAGGTGTGSGTQDKPKKERVPRPILKVDTPQKLYPADLPDEALPKYRTSAGEKCREFLYDMVMGYSVEYMVEANSKAKSAKKTRDADACQLLRQEQMEAKAKASVGGVVGVMLYSMAKGRSLASGYDEQNFPRESQAVKEIDKITHIIMNEVKAFSNKNSDFYKTNNVTVGKFNRYLEALGATVNPNATIKQKQEIGRDLLRQSYQETVYAILDGVPISQDSEGASKLRIEALNRVEVAEEIEVSEEVVVQAEEVAEAESVSKSTGLMCRD